MQSDITQSTIRQVLHEIKSGLGIGLAEAVRPLRHPKPPNSATAFRWCTEGVKTADGRRVKLEHARIGSRIVTSSLAVERFILALTDCNQATSPVRTPTQRAKAAANANQELIELGV